MLDPEGGVEGHDLFANNTARRRYQSPGGVSTGYRVAALVVADR